MEIIITLIICATITAFVLIGRTDCQCYGDEVQP